MIKFQRRVTRKNFVSLSDKESLFFDPMSTEWERKIKKELNIDCNSFDLV